MANDRGIPPKGHVDPIWIEIERFAQGEFAPTDAPREFSWCRPNVVNLHGPLKSDDRNCEEKVLKSINRKRLRCSVSSRQYKAFPFNCAFLSTWLLLDDLSLIWVRILCNHRENVAYVGLHTVPRCHYGCLVDDFGESRWYFFFLRVFLTRWELGLRVFLSVFFLILHCLSRLLSKNVKSLHASQLQHDIAFG